MTETPQPSSALLQALTDADAFPELVVLIEPAPDMLEAYALEERIGVIAVVSGPAERRAQALGAGALEVIDPKLPDVEAVARLETAVARFRSQLRLERRSDELAVTADALERDLRFAAKLQQSFLPARWPDVRGLRFSSAYLPREFVAGDSFDARALGPRHVGIYTMDAVGHGMQSALLTVLLRVAFRPLAGDGSPRPPAEVVAELDRRLRESDLYGTPTAALCYALYDLETRRLRVANAGHPLPIRLRPDGEVGPIGESDLLLGVLEGDYRTVEVELDPGDRVFMFTDGVGPDLGGRFVEQLCEHRDLDLDDQVAGALGVVVELDDEGRPEDDVTVLAFEVEAGS